MKKQKYVPTEEHRMNQHFMVFVDIIEREIFNLKRTLEYIMNPPEETPTRKPRSDIGKKRKPRKKKKAVK